MHGDIETGMLLLEAKAHVDEKCYWDRTPLHVAITSMEGMDESAVAVREKFCSLLLKNKANLNAQDTDEETPLLYATKMGNLNLVQQFLQEKSRLGNLVVDLQQRNIHGDTASDVAVKAKNKALFEEMFKAVPKDVQAIPGVIQLAVARDLIPKTPAIEKLLATKLDVRVTDPMAIYKLCHWGTPEATKKLTEYIHNGFPCKDPDSYGVTPLARSNPNLNPN